MDKRAHRKLVHDNLENKQMRCNLSAAMHQLQQNRAALIAKKYVDWQGIRNHAKAVKNNALMDLPALVEMFEKNATQNGIKVHYASSAEDACAIVLAIAKEHQISSVLKGKSMVSEEIGLNAYLQAHGVKAEESDLGELILQLSHDKPMHIVTPAVHRNRYEVGKIFASTLNVPETSDIQELNSIARKHLRQEFAHLKMGLSGVNFAIAEKGAM